MVKKCQKTPVVLRHFWCQEGYPACPQLMETTDDLRSGNAAELRNGQSLVIIGAGGVGQGRCHGGNTETVDEKSLAGKDMVDNDC